MSKSLTILMYSYQHLNFNRGGLQDQILYTKLALESLGHKVLFLDDWFKEMPQIDICHQFSIHYTLTNTFAELKARGVPIIISTVFNEKPTKFNQIARYISSFGVPILFHQNTRFFLKNCQFLVSLGDWESSLLKKNYKFETEIVSIPNGICQEIIDYRAKSISRKDKYVVCVGKICEGKNQLELIRACNELNYPLVLIGPEAIGEKDYVQKCKMEAGVNVKFVGYLDNKSTEFMDLVSNASVFALISKNEVLPISVFESISLGTPVSCTKNCSITDYFKDKNIVDLCDPDSPIDIKRSLQKTMNLSLTESIVQEVREEYTWLNVAKRLEIIYYKILKKK